jgi:hypothetical protein
LEAGVFRYFFSFERVNWWVLLGGLGLNLIISLFSSLVGTYLSVAEETAAFYVDYGPPLMLLAVFLACGLAGWIVAKISYDVPLRHAFLSGLGAAVPYVFFGVTSLNPWLLMLAFVALAGNLNGARLAMPRRHVGED